MLIICSGAVRSDSRAYIQNLISKAPMHFNGYKLIDRRLEIASTYLDSLSIALSDECLDYMEQDQNCRINLKALNELTDSIFRNSDSRSFLSEKLLLRYADSRYFGDNKSKLIDLYTKGVVGLPVLRRTGMSQEERRQFNLDSVMNLRRHSVRLSHMNERIERAFWGDTSAIRAYIDGKLDDAMEWNEVGEVPNSVVWEDLIKILTEVYLIDQKILSEDVCTLINANKMHKKRKVKKSPALLTFLTFLQIAALQEVGVNLFNLVEFGRFVDPPFRGLGACVNHKKHKEQKLWVKKVLRSYFALVGCDSAPSPLHAFKEITCTETQIRSLEARNKKMNMRSKMVKKGVMNARGKPLNLKLYREYRKDSL